jgi:hypothetical protein
MASVNFVLSRLGVSSELVEVKEFVFLAVFNKAQILVVEDADVRLEALVQKQAKLRVLYDGLHRQQGKQV